MPAALFGLPYPQPTAMGFLPWLREYYHSPATTVTHSRAVETRGRIREPGFDHVHVSSATNGHGIPPMAAGFALHRRMGRRYNRGGFLSMNEAILHRIRDGLPTGFDDIFRYADGSKNTFWRAEFNDDAHLCG